MTDATPFAEPTPTPDAAVVQVRKTIAAVTDLTADDPAVDRAAREAVAELWDRPVRTFVPVLAARAVRDRLAPGPLPEAIPGPDDDGTPAPRDGDRDVLLLDPRDTLTPD